MYSVLSSEHIACSHKVYISQEIFLCKSQFRLDFNHKKYMGTYQRHKILI